MRIVALIMVLLGAGWACSGGGKEARPASAGAIAVVGGKSDGAGAALLTFEEQAVGETGELSLILRNEGGGAAAATLPSGRPRNQDRARRPLQEGKSGVSGSQPRCLPAK